MSYQDKPTAPPMGGPSAPYEPPHYTAPPPPYAPPMPQHSGMMYGPPPVPGYAPPQYQHPPAYGYPQPAPQAHYVVHAQFDQGARFNEFSRPNIPPPPPGVAPNMAQMALMQGQNTTVIAEQHKSGFFSGSGSGGTTFW